MFVMFTVPNDERAVSFRNTRFWSVYIENGASL